MSFAQKKANLKKKEIFFKKQIQSNLFRTKCCVEMIMGATHDIKILDFPFFLAAVG